MQSGIVSDLAVSWEGFGQSHTAPQYFFLLECILGLDSDHLHLDGFVCRTGLSDSKHASNILFQLAVNETLQGCCNCIIRSTSGHGHRNELGSAVTHGVDNWVRQM